MGPKALHDVLRISSCSLHSDVKEESLDENHIVISTQIQDESSLISTHALVDCGATGFAFIDEEFARGHNFPLFKLKKPRCLEVIDGRPVESGLITHMTKLNMTIAGHKEIIPLFVTKLGHYPIVLGLPWLRRHDVKIRFAKNTVTFDSDYCLNNCCENATSITGISIPIPEKQKLHIAMIAGSTYTNLVKRKRNVVAMFTTTVYQIDRLIKEYDRERDRLYAASLGSEKKEESEEEKIKRLLPKEYHEFMPLFKKAVADVLPPHRQYDHKITLKEGFTPPFGPIYSLSIPELKALREWLDENLSKGFIRASSSPAGAPILFVKKSDGSLRLCVDYRGLNAGTIKNRYPLPLIRETLMRLSKARYYTALDVRSAYNLLRVAEGDEWKTAFRTRYGLYESLVMPFGLTNAPADFQRFINDVLHPFLDAFCTAYLDDILIYSESLEEHQEHVKKVLQALSKVGLHLKPEKCEFHKTEVKYLGLIISADGVKMD